MHVVRAVLDRLTPDDSGKFFSHEGSEVPWEGGVPGSLSLLLRSLPVRSLPFLLCLLLAAPARAGDDNSVKVIRLTLHPRGASVPALQYRLLPDFRDLTPGDAFPLYEKFSDALDTFPAEDLLQVDDWLKLRPEDLPRERVRAVLARAKEPLALIDKAARCERCNWDIADRIRKDAIGALLPEVQDLRTASSLLALRARLEIAEGRIADALRTVRTGLAVARHLNDTPTLISHLVGVAIASRMLDQLDLLLGVTDVPNLYWPLTDLPRPLLPMRVGMGGERLMSRSLFPGLGKVADDLEAGPMSQEDLRKCSKTLFIIPQELGIQVPVKGYPARVLVAFAIRAKHAAAKEALIAQGRPAELVEKMPHVQVALLHALLQYDKHFDALARWDNVPYWEARPHLAAARKAQQEDLANPLTGPAIPLARYLLPALGNIRLANLRVERRLSGMRCVEALRLYAAEHGRFPPSLSAVSVPLPVDPVTGKPFPYSVDGDRATLTAPPPAEERADRFACFRYEMTLKRDGK
jgi:hypothetical protein